MISTSTRNGCLGQKINFLEIICVLSLLPLKKAQDYLETMQTIDLHHLQCQTEGLFGSFCDENRLRGENFSSAKYINRVILVDYHSLVRKPECPNAFSGTHYQESSKFVGSIAPMINLRHGHFSHLLVSSKILAAESIFPVSH